MDIDDVYKEIGEFGSYQKKIFWSFSLVQALMALHQVHNYKLYTENGHWPRRSATNDVPIYIVIPQVDYH